MELTRFTEIRKSEDGKYRFQLSDESVDRHGTVIRFDAWDFTNYEKNPIVLYMHEGHTNNPDYVIGKGVVTKDNGAIFVDVDFEPDNELAQKIQKKVDFGSLRSTSVGFLPKSGHWGEKDRGEDQDVYYFDSVELLEASIVNIPSNANAVKKDYRSYLEDKAEQKEGTKTQEKTLSHFEARYNFLINK